MSHTKLLSPKELGEAIGVSESSVKRWVDDGQIEATRTVGGHRRISFPAAVRFIRAAKIAIVRPEILGLSSDQAGASNTRTDETSQFRDHLEAGRAEEARSLIWSLFLQGASPADIIDGPMQHAMSELGDKWQHGPQGIFIEHRATEICSQTLNQLHSAIEAKPDAPVAIGGAFPGDPSSLASLGCSLVLASEGFRAMNLGGNLPLDALRAAIELHDPKIVWMSCTHVDPALNGFAKDLYVLGDELSGSGSQLVLGGRGIDSARVTEHPTIMRAQRLSELAAFARGVLARS